MALEYLQVFADQRETLETYSDEERGRLFSAMMAYAFDGEEPTFDGAERHIWPELRKHIDRCAASVEKNRANGSRRGKAKSDEKQGASEAEQGSEIIDASKAIPSESDLQEAIASQREAKPSDCEPNEAKPSQTDHNQSQSQSQSQSHMHTQEHDHTEEKGAKPPKPPAASRRFTPPTVNEVDAYCQECGYTVDASQFCDFYASKGWKVGPQPMKDWKAAVRNWARRDAQMARAAPARAQSAAPETTNKFLRIAMQMREEGGGT